MKNIITQREFLEIEGFINSDTCPLCGSTIEVDEWYDKEILINKISFEEISRKYTKTGEEYICSACGFSEKVGI